MGSSELQVRVDAAPAGEPPDGRAGEDRERLRVEIPPRTVVTVLLITLAFLAGMNLLLSMRQVLVWAGTAVFLAIALNPLVTLLERWMGRTAASLVVFAGFLVGLGLVLALLVGPFVGQIDQITKTAPAEATRLEHNHTVAQLNRHYHVIARLKAHAGSLPGIAFGAAGRLVSGAAATVTVLFLTLFTLLELPRIGELILSQCTTPQAERMRGIGRDINRNVGGYVAGNLLISLIAGVVTTASLFVLQVPYALTLGILVAVFDLLPLVGATIGSVIVLAVTFVSQGTTAMLILLVVIVVYQQAENHILQPVIYRRTVQLPALVVMIAVLTGAALLGVLGALVAIPIAGTLQVLANDLLAIRARRIRAAEAA